jgi:hypothetical protein
MKYFNNCKTLDEIHTLYRQLAMQHHPDHGVDTSTMQEINIQYADALTRAQLGNERSRQAAAHTAGKKTYADFHDLDDVFQVLTRKIMFILDLSSNLQVELTGAWLWIHGDTRPVKEELKAEGFRWAPDKKLWFYAGVPTFNRQRRSMDEIRGMYGSHIFYNKPEEAQALPLKEHTK